LLLINPEDNLYYKLASLGLAYLASVLEKCGQEVKVTDCKIEKRCLEKISESLKKEDTVGITSNVATIKSGMEIARFIRDNFPEKRIIFGGPHPSIIYRDLIPELADIVVIGEGEETIRELVEGKPLNEINGIAYWDNGLKVNPPRPLIKDLDTLPFPA